MRALEAVALIGTVSMLLTNCRRPDDLGVSMAIARWNCTGFEDLDGFFVVPEGQATGLRVECRNREWKDATRERIPSCRPSGYLEVLRHSLPPDRKPATLEMAVSWLPPCSAAPSAAWSSQYDPFATADIDVFIGDAGWQVSAERPRSIH